ncbi:hypothetical protein [Polynucleobacter necessarius]|uniref:hypothetical protein n=1 Tax=Polynucleobacter necessarius TaxID=576610 RepID=UPI0013B05908|nr:hypothetical protein [Polynucleobacter necessarius]
MRHRSAFHGTFSVWFLLAFIGSFGPSMAHGQAASQDKKSYSINDLIQVALESSPQVLAARDQAKAIRGQLSTARAIPNPGLKWLLDSSVQ